MPQKRNKNTYPLPRLTVYYRNYRLVNDENGETVWEGKDIEVEVLSVHFNAGTMRVRSVEKIAWSGGDRGEIRSFDLPYTAFLEKYHITSIPQ